MYEAPTPAIYETKTFFTTYTFFTTLFAGTEPVVTSSEQVITNVVTVPLTTKVPHASPTVSEILGPVTVFDTSETVITRTKVNTVTFYATLFSDTSSFVTPIEEVQTDISTVTETFTIARTILPTSSAFFAPFITETKPITETTTFVPELEPSVVVTQTLYTTFTNFVTLFQGTDTIVTNLEEIVSNVVTLTVPAHVASSFTETTAPASSENTFKIVASETTPVYTTREVLSTQTHYLTLFNNDQSLLSSIEEVVTRYVTELVTPFTSYSSYTTYEPKSPVKPSLDISLSTSEILLSPTEIFATSSGRVEEVTTEISTYHPELVPSIRTIYSTLTFYTTYYSDTSSIIASQEEILTSYVTLFVPPSLITTTKETTDVEITPTSTSDPSVFVFTTTDYSTLTLYTTLFSGDEIVVISSEHVVPEIITATITPSSTTPTEASTKDESVLTFLTTFTYYTTYFSGIDPVIASSESVVTQFVTIEAAPTTSPSIEPTIDSTPVETIIGVSTASVANVASSFNELSSDLEIIGVSSATAIGLEIDSTVETKVQVDSKIHTEVGFTPGLSSPALSTVDVIELPRTTLGTPSLQTGLSKSVLSSEKDIFILESSRITESSSLSSSDILPSTTSTVVTEKTDVVGLDGIVTHLMPSDTLLMITGTDGFVTKVPKVDTAALSPVYIPATKTISSTLTSEIKPATVIELSDLLGGNTAFGGDIGLAIKDIVSLITGKKNKTDEGIATDKLSDSTDPDIFALDITTESSDYTTEVPLKKDTITAEKGEKENAAAKDLDYPIFVLPSKDTDTKSMSDVLAPVYVPTEVIRNVESELARTTGLPPPSRPDKQSTKISKSVSTSIITGARTVFIVPTKATSIVDDKRDRYTIEPRIPKLDVLKDTKVSRPEVTTETKISTDFSESSIPPFGITRDTFTLSHQVTKESKSFLPEIRNQPAILFPETKRETLIVSSMNSVSKDGSIASTPGLKPSITTSIVSGVRTVFFDPNLHKTSSQQNIILPSVKEDILGRANAAMSSSKPFTTLTKGGQTVISRSTSGATTIFFPGQIPRYTVPVISTRYITSVESITRTLALTTTRTYYTRDSTLTVPSVYTTTIPPRTFVSTIIGSRTILGILPEPTENLQIHKTLEPSERTTTVTTTTLIFNSIPSTVIRTLVLPTGLPTKAIDSGTTSTHNVADSNIFNAGTEAPAKPPEVGDSTVVTKEDIAEENVSLEKPFQKARDETYLRAANPRIHDDHSDMQLKEEAPRPPIVVTEAVRPEDDPFLNGRNGVCDPKCQPYKKEICKETDGFWTCQCRPGHARRDDHDICKGKY